MCKGVATKDAISFLDNLDRLSQVLRQKNSDIFPHRLNDRNY